MAKKEVLGILILATIAVILMSGCAQQQTQQQAQTQNQIPTTSQQQATVPQAQTNAILIQNFAFSPQTLTVNAGTTVTWTNDDSAPHTIKSDAFTSPVMNKGGSFSFKFDNKGSYDYSCSIHPSMKGKIVVE